MADDLGFVPDQQAPSPPTNDQQNQPQEEQSSGDQSPTITAQGISNLPEPVDTESLGFVPDNKYLTTEQQLKGSLEGVGKGWLGPIAPLIETKVLGVNPEDIRGREEAQSGLNTTSQIAGFGLGMLTGTGEAALLSKIGEGATSLAGLSEATTVGSKLAKGAVGAAAELGLFQAGDEASKAILQDPNQTVGSAVANVGLSTVLGATGGAALSGLGQGLKATVNSPMLKEFMDRLSFRKANIDPNEMMRSEFENAHSTLSNMGTEIGGVDGIRSQALGKLMPEMSPKIQNQAEELLAKIDSVASTLNKSGDKAGMVDSLNDEANKLRVLVSPTPNAVTGIVDRTADPKAIFDTINDIKRQLGEWGKFNKAFVPLTEVGFRNSAKGLGYAFKTALEDPSVWGKAGELQKNINGAWTSVIPALKDAESKFMTKVGGEPVVDPQKFQTYINTTGKATSQTIRQQMMGNFVKSVGKFQDAAGKAYEAAGVDNPFQPVGMSALKESLGLPSQGAKLADLWHDKLGASTIGNTMGIGVGGAAGRAVGHDFEGAWIGKTVLGPVFTSVLKPLLEKYPNVDLKGFQAATTLAKNIVEGNTLLTKAANNIFESGTKVLPSKYMPTQEDTDKLNKQTQSLNSNITPLQNVAGSSGYYLPDHSVAMGKTAGDAIAYINSQRPNPTKALPFDEQPKPTKMQEANFNRTLSVAQQPLVALHYLKEGTLLPQDIATLKNVYPDYYNKMSQQLTSQMVNSMTKEESVPYKIKQGLSMFLEQPLDSTMTPSSIQAAQNVFAAQNAANQAASQVSKPKKNTSKMGEIANQHYTGEQAAQMRQRKE